MVGITFDVLAPSDPSHFLLSGGFDGVYLFLKHTPKPGFEVVKVTHGVHVLWEAGASLLSLTLHKLGNLPVALLLHLDGSDLFFVFENLEWKGVTKVAYENKLHGHHNHFNPEELVLDFAHADPDKVVSVPFKYGHNLSTTFVPGLGVVFVGVKEGDDVLWKAGHAGDKCLHLSVHALNGVSDFARLSLVESGHALEKCFEKVGGKWTPLGFKGYLDKRAPAEPFLTSVDLSAKEPGHHVLLYKGGHHGLPFDVFLCSVLASVFKVVDGDQVLWEARGGERGLHVTLAHDGFHAHLLVLTPDGLKEHGFVKKNGKWVAADGGFPVHLKLLVH
ncbi:hypothetical protein BEWA_003750 [Theileria equi strain WA]|uniref:Uncharacterized protein n=1 Tax=Theileria equi strain WA TaxID=1537102 RepID=L0AZF5_THEEQ|nr:hypothetical protein BEWA_003750 [Theileria equi strain WA]AFZ80967.1 hypothetical protein BEWA_003750 [Theileria equi strain WA]|eukprot:XP_004830633.1 hypothetical protein BEWA_003750 [Theileria equi strain WA]